MSDYTQDNIHNNIQDNIQNNTQNNIHNNTLEILTRLHRARNASKKAAIGRIMYKKLTFNDIKNKFSRLDYMFFSEMFDYFYNNIVTKNIYSENFNVRKYYKQVQKHEAFQKRMYNNGDYARRKMIEFCNNSKDYIIANHDDFDSSSHLVNTYVLKNVDKDCYVYYCCTLTEAVDVLQKKYNRLKDI